MGKRLLAIIVLATLFFIPPPTQNKFVVLDIGQGDSLLIETAQHHSVLIDGGPSENVLAELPEHFSGDHIDLIVATQYDADHSSGLIAVLEQYQVAEVWLPVIPPQTQTGNRLYAAAQAEGAKVKIPQLGDRYTFDNFTLTVLSPDPTDTQSEDTLTNDHSTILGVSFGTTDLLLTADAPTKKISQAFQRWTTLTLPLEVLKVGHHGSRTATSVDLLKQLSPQQAVISVGENNSYGHPHPETLQALEQTHIPYSRTDQQGSLEFWLTPDGGVTTHSLLPGVFGWIQVACAIL